jgi:hypothetical protein
MRIWIFLISLLICKNVYTQDIPGKIHVLGSFESDIRDLIINTINDQHHEFAHSVNFQPESNLYTFPYKSEGVWHVVSFLVQGDHHQSALFDLALTGDPLKSLNSIREIIGYDGSLKYISWKSYNQLPSEKIYLASGNIAQNNL